MDAIFVKYIHFLSIMALSTALVAEYITLIKEVTSQQLRKAVTINTIYSISILLIFITGLLLWLSVGKSAEYYTSNWLFHIKLTIFIVIAVLSIYPTVFLLKNRKTGQEIIKIPKSVLILIQIKFVLLIPMPLIAVLIANGIGNF